MVVNLFFALVVKSGNLKTTDAMGRTRSHGDGAGPPVHVRIHDLLTEIRIFLRPKLAIGEAYMNGKLTLEQGSLYDFLDICMVSTNNLQRYPLWILTKRLRDTVRYILSFNPVGRARRNVAHHYDLSGKLYDLFLDSDRQYSCAYFDHPDQSLEEAQANKKRHLAAKLLLDRPGLKLLDIGSGWGGLGLYLAQDGNAIVKGLTLSEEQHKVSTDRAIESGLDRRTQFELKDYRLEEGQYDRIVSVGMFEHVGPAHFREFFRKCRSLLKDDGVMVLHAIGTFEPPGATNPWITKYIFPGGYIPSLSEVLAAIEKERLVTTDIEVLRLHYAETLRHWRRRFYANMERVRMLYDERFCRMWDFYLTGCELTFRRGNSMVFQIQLAKNKQAVPLKRDYITDSERGGDTRRSWAAE